MATLLCFFSFTASALLVFSLCVVCQSEEISMVTDENEGYSEFYEDGMTNTNQDSAHLYNSQFNVNQKLQRQTREVVMMNYLPRVDPVKVGYTRNIQIVRGKTHGMKTLAINPPIFEVENFLTDVECQTIIDLANANGLEASTTVRTPKTAHLPRQHILDIFSKKDVDADGLLDPYEIGEFFITIKDLYLGDNDIKQLLSELQLDTDEDGRLSNEELFLGIEAAENYDKFYGYLDNLETRNPERKIRHSDTVFLKPSVLRSLFDDIRYRIVNMTGLPYAIVKAGENLQVVKYNPSGHYHSHLDSENIDRATQSQTCCQYMNWDRGCTLCRYMTVLYFLNDVEEGGETAFPIADNVTVDTKILYGKERHRLDLGRHCHDANVYYKPKKGAALMWYNHKLDKNTGWFGEVDIRSYHGGCNVVKGSKWIANNWIDASPDYAEDIDNWVKILFKE